MYRFFEPVISPLLEAVDPQTVVEVGSDRGYLTELLAEWCAKHQARLHTIDPLPKYDVDEWVVRWPETLTFHRDLSLNALTEIDSPDVVCIDGDHNWYTVVNELRLLADRCDGPDSFPITLLHDVGWPYGRRDLYYDPQTIPDAQRHPYAEQGIVPGRKRLGPEGFNAHLANAQHEGTPRNGVRTAAEDFVAEREGIELHTMAGINGLGIVLSAATREALGEQWAALTGTRGIVRVLEATEEDRVRQLIAASTARQHLATNSERIEQLRGQVGALEVGLRNSRAEADQHRRERDETALRLTEQTTELERVSDELLTHQRRGNQLSLALDELETQNQALRSQSIEARSALQSERDELHRMRGAAVEAEASLKRQRAATGAANDQLERARVDAREQRQYAARKMAEQEQRLEDLQRQVADREHDLDQQRAHYRSLERGYRQLRTRRSVRLALKLAAIARPAFQIRRAFSK